jgi:hypothetical protein
MVVTDPLQQAIARCTAEGWHLRTATTNTAVMTFRHGGDINHVMHGLLSLFTCGAWLAVWLFIVVSNPEHTMLIMVNEAGEVSYQQSRR